MLHILLSLLPLNPVNKYLHIFGISNGAGTYFQGPYSLFGGTTKLSQTPSKKKSVRSSPYRRLHAVAYVSAYLHVPHVKHGTRFYIFFFLGGGLYLWGIAARQQQISVKNEGYLISEGYLQITSLAY